MNVDSAHKSRWEIAEVIFGIPFLVSVAIQLLVPLSLPQGILRQTFIFIGIAFIITGMGFIVLARREFAQFSQPTDPGHPTTEVITTGVFAISRNPIYFGAACFLFGVGLAMNWLWVLAFLLPGLVACHYVLIAPEEKYLLAKFGEKYRIYAASVHRWIGRARSPRER
jgi:protein-S-isoprenylcysteine O-methyltransferase Ste14